MFPFYPEHLQTLFTNRERELGLLEQVVVPARTGWKGA